MSAFSPLSSSVDSDFPGRTAAFAKADALLCVAVLSILTAVVIPILAGPRPQQDRVVCTNNLRLIGQSFLSFADSHGDRLPALLTRAAGGSSGTSSAADFYRPLSNHLASPRVLVCPSSSRPMARSFETLRDANLSYALGGHASPDKAWEIMSADFDVEGGTFGTCSFLGKIVVTAFEGATGVPETFFASWSGTNHVASGNVLLSDGSVAGGDSKYLQKVIANSSREGSSSVHLLQPR